MSAQLAMAQAKGEPIQVEIDYQQIRVCAEIFEIQDGLAFVDIGWNDQNGTSHNPYHIIKGQAEKNPDGTWGMIETLPDGTLREFIFSRIKPDTPQMREWQAWQREKHNQGREYAREEAWQQIESLIQPEPDQA